jgi:RNA polymerase sigma-70 factor (ECF subfamily)
MDVDHTADNSSLFRTMAARHTQALYSLALARTSDRDDAWDLVQEVYERALRRKPPVPDDRALRAWLVVVLRNIFIDRYRTVATRRADIDLEALPMPEPEPDQPCFWSNVSVEMIERLGEDLRPTARDVFRLHLKGLPVRVIATELGIPATTVSRKLFRARRKIRERISATSPLSGFTPEAAA